MDNSGKVFDGLLVLEYRSGKKRAFEILVKRYHKKLCRHAYSYTHDFDASRDIVQDSWTIMIHKIESLKKPNRFGSWAFRIVSRKALDFLNKRKRQISHLAAYKNSRYGSDNQDNNESQIQMLRHMVRVLPKDQQIVLRLFYTEEYSLKEISEILEVSVGTIKSRLFHARERLKLKLKE